MIDLIETLCDSGYDFDMAVTLAEQFEQNRPLLRIREEPRKDADNVERV